MFNPLPQIFKFLLLFELSGARSISSHLTAQHTLRTECSGWVDLNSGKISRAGTPLRSPWAGISQERTPSGLGSIDFLRLSLETTPNLPGEDLAWEERSRGLPVTGVTLAIHTRLEERTFRFWASGP